MSRSLNPRQLEAFRAVMVSGSITGAGRLLSISQPAVTRLIRDLELDIGLPLFSRGGTTVMPTPEARAFYAEVERYFISTDRLREIATGIREHGTGRLRIAAIPALSGRCLPDAISTYLAEEPATIISVHNGASVDIIDLVTTNRVDIGLLARPVGFGDMDYRALPEGEVVCILPRGHALSELDAIRPEDMHGQDYIALGPGSLMRMEFEAMMRGAEAQPRLRAESLFSGTVVPYVNRGLGIAVVDPLVAAEIDTERVVVRRFVPRIRYQLFVVYAPGVLKNPLIEHFIDIFERAYSDVMQTTEGRIQRAD